VTRLLMDFMGPPPIGFKGAVEGYSVYQTWEESSLGILRRYPNRRAMALVYEAPLLPDGAAFHLNRDFTPDCVPRFNEPSMPPTCN
jgi:hypothetical protein